MPSPYSSYDDAALVSGFLADDSACFDEIHDRYRLRIYRFAVKRLRDATEAEDVTQEVFLEAYRGLAKFEGRSALTSWLYGIAHHLVCRRFRVRRLAVASLDEAGAREVAGPSIEPTARIDAVRHLKACVSVLDNEVSDAQREVFSLRYEHNMSTRAIAEELGKSNQAVKISLFRTRRRLAERTASHDQKLANAGASRRAGAAA